MKTAYVNDGMIEMPSQRTAQERRDGRARATRIIALAEAAISGESGRTDITNIPDDELLARYRRMKLG